MARSRPGRKQDGVVRVNRAPVLTLWAAVVAERLGHAPDAALSLGSAIGGTAAQSRARRIHHGETIDRDSVDLLGHEVRIIRAPDGRLFADAQGSPAPAEPIRRYLERAFGTRLDEVRQAMEQLAAQIGPGELNRSGLGLYEAFRPEMPKDAAGKGELRLDRIRDALQIVKD